MKLTVKSKVRDYEIFIKKGLLDEISNYLDVNKQYVLICDNQIPKTIIEKISKQLKIVIAIEFPAGEKSKSISEFQLVINLLINNNISKDVTILAVGGGVTGDLTGFIASTLYRGVNYIQIPTTLLSQVDSSVGGKVAINADSSKNTIGSFYPPEKVLIDPETLKSLPKRQFNNGVAEIIKYALIASPSLFNKLFEENIESCIEEIIYECLEIKREIVEKDEFDTGRRHILNFGHTYGHAYEAKYNFTKYLHGEAVSLGMMKMVSDSLKDQLKSLLVKYNLPVTDPAKTKDLLNYIKHDKKATTNSLSVVFVDEIGKAKIIKIPIKNLETELI